jgi:putative Holliday junction resolvase
MKNMRVMALDVGDKTVGVAISDALLLTAQSRPTLRRKNIQADIDALHRLALENEVHEVVVGDPLHMDGRESPQSRKVKQFAEQLRNRTGLPVFFWDERLTSFEAEQQLEQLGLNWRRRRRHVDQMAAMIILQNYLDNRKSHSA